MHQKNSRFIFFFVVVVVVEAWKLKCHFGEILITDCTESCQNKNFRAVKKISSNYNISTSVEEYKKSNPQTTKIMHI